MLVAGIGNVFLGDDGFGVALAGRLARGEPQPGVEVVDFGIRGMDLAYALLGDYDAAILLDATPRGGPPGTLYVIEPEIEGVEAPPDAHGMDPVQGARPGAGARRARRRALWCWAASRRARTPRGFSASRSAPRSTRPSAWWRRCWRN